mmetsp:Transcript_26576/g.77294  ORF Transcript_26576/g.77294 Transcript_26576/m.77294 type:complete len:300 (-) Transcript_26576:1152-2051(-)
MVQAGEAGNGEGVVEPGVDELLRRGLKKLGELTAAAVEVVLVRHDDLQPVLARLLDLLGQPLVGPGVGVQIEKHVRGVARLLGGGDGETGEIGGELAGQLVCALIERRGPEHDGLGEGDRLALDLARDEEREGGQVQVVWRAEEERLGDDLKRDTLILVDAVPRRLRPPTVKDLRLEDLRALCSQLLQRPAALGRVRLLHEDERLALLERRPNLAQAVLRAEVAPRQEEEHDLRAVNVILQRPDVLQIVHIEEDLDAGDQELKLILDDRDGVLAGGPDVREEEVPREAVHQSQLGGLLG